MSEANVLLLSMRRISTLVGYCSTYEFEDVVQATTAAQRIDVVHDGMFELSRRAYKYLRYGTGSRWLASKLTPAPMTIPLQRDYDLLFAVFNHPYELYTLAALHDWQARCKTSICFITELWSHQLPSYLLELLSGFDRVFVGCSTVVPDVTRLIGKQCLYLPSGVDALKFSPYPELPERSIDVCNIGRRSQATHQALLAERRRHAYFYYYDTVAASGPDGKQRTFSVQDASEHRLLYAAILRRSRYYIANRARANEPSFTARGDEIANRFYEGAAAGAVMIGEAPKSREFRSQFDWPDALIPIPFDAPHIGGLLAELDRDPERLLRIRRENVYQISLRHDWLYRLKAIFDVLRLPPTAGMLDRQRKLRTLATLAKTQERQERFVRPGRLTQSDSSAAIAGRQSEFGRSDSLERAPQLPY